tara:strand:+ start:168 stop:377 length:210 start_codon:yes stop_codon:yes gene_type:complete
MWRSPVAYSSGGRVVAGSNPVIPTISVHPNLKACKFIDLQAFLFFIDQFDLDNFSKNENQTVNQMIGYI